MNNFCKQSKLLYRHARRLLMSSPAQDASRSIVYKSYMRKQEVCASERETEFSRQLRRRPGSDRAALHRTVESWTTPTPRYAAARDTHDPTGINHHQREIRPRGVHVSLPIKHFP